MSKTFTYSLDELKTIGERTVKKARARGADSAVVQLSEQVGLSVNVREGRAEQSEYAHDKSLSLSVRINAQMGSASTSDLSDNGINEALTAAINFARYTSPDPFAELPDPTWLAKPSADNSPDLNLYHPWALSMDEAFQIAQNIEAQALAKDERLIQSDGCAVSTGMGQSVLANSLDFLEGLMSSHHSVSCALIAQNEQGMQRDGWYEDSREPLLAEHWRKVIDHSAERTLRRLSPRKIATAKVPVIFDETVAPSLIHALIRAVSGGALYRKASFMLDSLGKQALPEFVNITEDPFIIKGLASKPFDNEGVRVRPRTWIDKGRLNGYFLSSYSARKLGMESTGHAGGAHNLVVRDARGGVSLSERIRAMPRGILITELMGQGVNGVTGDYSRGAGGFWIERGEIAYPVEEFTIAGNVKDMLLAIEGISTPSLRRGGMDCGALLIGEMMVAGH